jgi:hypothetical protein
LTASEASLNFYWLSAHHCCQAPHVELFTNQFQVKPPEKKDE